MGHLQGLPKELWWEENPYLGPREGGVSRERSEFRPAAVNGFFSARFEDPIGLRALLLQPNAIRNEQGKHEQLLHQSSISHFFESRKSHPQNLLLERIIPSSGHPLTCKFTVPGPGPHAGALRPQGSAREQRTEREAGRENGQGSNQRLSGNGAGQQRERRNLFRPAELRNGEEAVRGSSASSIDLGWTPGRGPPLELYKLEN